MSWKDHARPGLTATERKRRNSPTMPVGRWIVPWRRLSIYLRDDFRCLLCTRDLAQVTPREVTLDHWRPRARGGSNESRNLFTACHACNSARGNGRLPPGSRERVAMAVRRRFLAEWGKPGVCQESLAKGMLRGAANWEHAMAVAAIASRTTYQRHRQFLPSRVHNGDLSVTLTGDLGFAPLFLPMDYGT